jgi:P-type E1-E2 ATPase
MIDEELTFLSNQTLLEIGKIIITATILLIVAIPEGLPLTVSIAMALSIDNLKKDQILIKNVESVQTCAMLDELCVSKTGTLTKGDLKVVKIHFKNENIAHEERFDEF